MTGGSGTNTFNIKSTGVQTISDLKGSDVITTTAGVNNLVATVSADYTATSATINRSTGVDDVKLQSNAAKVDIDVSSATSTVTGFWLLGDNAGAEKLIGSNQADTINGQAGNDTLSGGAGSDTLTGGTGADSIVAGEGADSIFGGTGIDTITLTETTSAVDAIVVSSGLTIDTVTGFAAGTDKVHFDISLMETSGAVLTGVTQDYVEIFDNLSAPTAAITTQTLTGAATASDAVGMFLIDLGATKFANAAAAVDALEASNAAALTFAGNIVADDAFLIAYENNTSGVNIASINFSANDDNSSSAAAAPATTLESADLLTLAGITDVTTLSGDFSFIA
jgi:Ca2+-binding RTX toxin-like protein